MDWCGTASDTDAKLVWCGEERAKCLSESVDLLADL